MDLLTQIFGWLGAVLILTGYFLNSTGKLNHKTSAYQIINLIGAFCLIVNTYYNKAYPATFLNVTWCIIAIWGLIKKER